MPASSATSLLLFILAFLPGAAYTWAFERQIGSFGVSFADRSLRFIGSSVVFHLLFAPAEYAVFRVAFADGRPIRLGEFLIVWLAAVLLVVLPHLTGAVLGGLYRTRSRRGEHWRWIRRHLSRDGEDRLLRFALGHEPAPRAWDHLFSDRTSAYVRVQLRDGTWVAGRFADRSYAGGYPNPTDLLLEDAWQVDQEGGALVDDVGLGYPVYIAAGEFVLLERLPERSTDTGPTEE
jgi:hypothetical protein